jgi:hypothetical protein
MSYLGHLIVGAVWTPTFVVKMAATMLLAKLVFRPLGNWWVGKCLGKQRLLERDTMARWLKSGGQHPVHEGWRDHSRAWWRCLTWRWSKEGKELREMWRNIPLPPPNLCRRNF